VIQTLSGRLIRYTLLAILPIQLVVVVLVYTFASRELAFQVKERAHLLAGNAVRDIRLILEPITDIPRALAVTLGGGALDESTVEELLEQSIQLNDDVFGMALGLEPGVLGPTRDQFCPYVFRDGDTIRSRRLDTPEYSYREMGWYSNSFATGQAQWSEPYFDEGGGDVLMSTYSVPVFGDGGRGLGIVTADISLGQLRDMVRSIRILDTGHSLLLSAEGRILVFREDSVVMRETVHSLAQKQESSSLAELGREMVGGRSGVRTVSGLGQGSQYRVVYQPVAHTGWSLAIFLPEAELFEPLKRLTRNLFLVGGLGMLLVLAGITLVARRATAEIHLLSEVSGQISEGRLDVPVPDGYSTVELRQLADSFRTMQRSLQEHIQTLMETTATRERMAGELRIAREIQMSILPKIFPPFPSRKDLDVFAMIEPAREVGGDLYDFFFLDDTRFCFVIGDVSGKGVPASLFMAVAKTLLKATVEADIPPDLVMERVNNALAQGNDHSMFVTVFLGVLDLGTGRLDYVNAGHNPPFLMRRNGVERLETTSGPALGGWSGAGYETRSVLVEKGEGVFCYTDGVNEAFDSSSEIYGMDRLTGILDGATGNNAEAVIREILEDVKRFAGDTDQSDDIAMLMVRRAE